ncbi:MAG TPA: hypothetical protein VFV66_12685, partial [Nonomuraea sp.]|nr:hypothetical protein [Nonomuraea sp.]
KVARRAGLEFADRIVCLLCGVGNGRLLNRASFFQLYEARKGWTRGMPIHATAHEDLLVFTKPAQSAGSAPLQNGSGKLRAGISRDQRPRGRVVRVRTARTVQH